MYSLVRKPPAPALPWFLTLNTTVVEPPPTGEVGFVEMSGTIKSGDVAAVAGVGKTPNSRTRLKLSAPTRTDHHTRDSRPGCTKSLVDGSLSSSVICTNHRA